MTSVQREDIKRAAGYELEWERFYGKTILVTGATGFIGSFIIETLLKNANQNRKTINIVALVRDIERAKRSFGPDRVQISYIEGDVKHPIMYEEHLDYVIHCASYAAPDLYTRDPVGTMETNLLGTLNTLNCAKKCGAERYLYVSTIEVYGLTKKELLAEDDFGYISSLNIRACYPESKKCCENLTVCYGKQFSIETVIGRLSYIYGAGMRECDTKVCAYFARETAKGNDIILKSAGTQRRSYTYISDAVTGLLMTLLYGESGAAYNVASPSSIISIADMAQTHCEMLPEKGTKVWYELPQDEEKKSFSFIEDAIMDSSKLMKLGWNPEVTLKQGIRLAIRHNIELLSN